MDEYRSTHQPPPPPPGGPLAEILALFVGSLLAVGGVMCAVRLVRMWVTT